MTDLKLDRFLPYRLSVTSNLVSDAIASTYRSLFGLAIPEWRLVAVLAEAGETTPQALTHATRMDKVTVSRAAAGLERRGLVERRAKPDDRRSHLLVLTGAGRTLYADVAPKALEMEARLFAGLSDDERAAFVSLLARIEASAGGLED